MELAADSQSNSPPGTLRLFLRRCRSASKLSSLWRTEKTLFFLIAHTTPPNGGLCAGNDSEFRILPEPYMVTFMAKKDLQVPE